MSKDAVIARKGAVHLAKKTCNMHFKGGTEKTFIFPEEPPSFQIKQQVGNVISNVVIEIKHPNYS